MRWEQQNNFSHVVADAHLVGASSTGARTWFFCWYRPVYLYSGLWKCGGKVITHCPALTQSETWLTVPCYLACIPVKKFIFLIEQPHYVLPISFLHAWILICSYCRRSSACQWSNRGCSSSSGLQWSTYHQMALVGWAPNCTYTRHPIHLTVSHRLRPASTASASLLIHPWKWWKTSCRRSHKSMWAAASVHGSCCHSGAGTGIFCTYRRLVPSCYLIASDRRSLNEGNRLSFFPPFCMYRELVFWDT